MFNAANALTMMRIAAVPVIAWMLYVPHGGKLPPLPSAIVTVIFGFASILDFLDGYIARKYGLVTDFGKLMDPVADKLMICVTMIMLIPIARLPAWLASLVVAREIGVTALRAVAANRGLVVAASRLGKAKSILLSFGTGFVMYHYPISGFPCGLFGEVLLTMGLFLSAWSGLDYVVKTAWAMRDM